ncbi:MAG: nickel pincer cofactor biosynthesis protein LarB [Armatimonadetes bacterium]|nr:nickel pincer cofactor biosynthesis protein LarB [Armatimonadota bacterium]
MDTRQLEAILRAVQAGETTIPQALAKLRDLPYQDLGFARIDSHRHLRTGFPEVVFCQGKTEEQVLAILARLSQDHATVLATRAAPEVAERVLAQHPGAVYHHAARIVQVGPDPEPQHPERYVAIVSAGTADIPVAEEAAVTARAMGSRVERLFDVGVAGLHRLLDQRHTILEANVVVVAAGMEGALASVVGGLVERPVIAVPTSIGYGASFQGLAALLAMLNTCAAGVAVVNIDNGFGAGYFAHLVNSTAAEDRG